MMGSLIKRTLVDSFGRLVSQKLKSAALYHAGAKVMFRRGAPHLQCNHHCVRKQPSVLMSQKVAAVSFDDPEMKKYVTDMLQSDNTDKSKNRPSYWNTLNELMNQREQLLANIKSLNELKLGEEGDKEIRVLAEEELTMYNKELFDLDYEILRTILPRDNHENYSDIVVELSSGAGGQEAMLFAYELLQLYENYASFRGWTFFVESIDKTDIGGIRSASIFIQGSGAFYFMQNEIGVHRVQRVPVTSNTGMIHTSTAAVIVMPQPSEVDIKIAEKDLVIETMRASGPGGQNVNKTESAVRVKHLPTGLVVECRENQSQHRNKEIALIKLRTKLYDIETQKQSKEISATRRSQLGNRERSAKIRTYNFPQNRVTDHRLQITTHNIKEFMEGGNAFHNFLEKLNEQHENQLVVQFIASIKENS